MHVYFESLHSFLLKTPPCGKALGIFFLNRPEIKMCLLYTILLKKALIIVQNKGKVETWKPTFGHCFAYARKDGHTLEQLQ